MLRNQMSMEESKSFKEKVLLDSDRTLRLSCRSGDYVLWLRCIDMFASGKDAFQIRDLWELKDGDHILITNRECDMPPVLIDSELDGPNIWRFVPGDRLIQIGLPRRTTSDKADKPVVLEIIECKQDTLVFGDSTVPRFDKESACPFFGTFPSASSPFAKEVIRLAIEINASLGLPRTLDIGG